MNNGESTVFISLELLDLVPTTETNDVARRRRPTIKMLAKVNFFISIPFSSRYYSIFFDINISKRKVYP